MSLPRRVNERDQVHGSARAASPLSPPKTTNDIAGAGERERYLGGRRLVGGVARHEGKPIGERAPRSGRRQFDHQTNLLQRHVTESGIHPSFIHSSPAALQDHQRSVRFGRSEVQPVDGHVPSNARRLLAVVARVNCPNRLGVGRIF